MQNVISKELEAADNQSKYIDAEAIKKIKSYCASGVRRVEAARDISTNAVIIIKEAVDQSLLDSDITCTGDNLYTTRSYRVCLRDLGYFIRYATYAMIAGDTSILDERVLNGLKETYECLGISINGTVRVLKALKEVTAKYIGQEASQEIAIYFDYIINSLQNSDSSPVATKEPEKESKHSESDRLLNYLQLLINRLSPEQKELYVNRLEKVLNPSSSNDKQDAFTASLIGHVLTKEERLELEFSNLLQQFNQRRELLEGSLTASQVAQLLGTSRQTPHDRIKAGSLLAILDNGVWRFPLWQFDPQGPDGVIAGLPEVLRTLEIPSFSQLSWLLRPNPFLDRLTPVDALKQGQKDRVIDAAKAVGVK